MAENTKSQQPTWEGIKDEFNAIAQSLTQYFENFKGESWKTFEPIYHKSQRPPKWASVISFVILPITYAVAISFSLTKYFYYLFCGKVKEYRFFDSYLIKQGEKIINISMIDKNIQKEVDVFLKEKRQIEPKNLKIFIDKVGYIYEKINFK